MLSPGGELPQKTVRLLQLQGLTKMELSGLWAAGLLLGAEGSSSYALVRERSKLRPGICTWLWGIFSYCFIMENLKRTAQLKALCSDPGTTLSGFNHYCFYYTFFLKKYLFSCVGSQL